MTKIKVTIKKIRFYNEDNGFAIFQVHNDQLSTFSLTGTIFPLEENEMIECTGDWFVDKKFGKQFKATHIQISKPDTLEGMKQYLSSGILPGIGPSSAEKIVKYFKENVFDILDNNPSRLLDVPGIGRKTLNRIIEVWAEKRTSPRIINELNAFGLDFAHSLKLYKLFGEDSVKYMKSSPYELLKHVNTLSFEDIDKIALKNGYNRQDGTRILMGILHVFKNEEDGLGNCAIDIASLKTKALNLLRVEVELIEQVLKLGLRDNFFDNTIINDIEYWQSYKISKFENDIAYFLKQLTKSKAYYNETNEDDLNSKIEKEEKKTFPLNPQQRNAVKKSLMNKVNIINGGPGVGKTTVLKQMISIARRDGYSVLLCAPTGRAAQRMSESTQMPASTIHRALEFNPLEGGFIKNITNTLDYDFIVVDEFSMVDIYLIHSLLAATNKNSHIVFIGDTNQLSSIGPGCILKDLIESGCISVAKITQIYRQAAESKIIVNAHRINEGKMVETEVEKDKKSDFYFLATKSDESTVDKIRDLVTTRIKEAFGIDPKTGIQLLTPMHDDTLGTKNLNIEIQALLNAHEQEGLKRGVYTFKKNDNIMQIKNNYEKMVFNGDVGVIDRVSQDGVLAVFAEQEVFYTKKEMEEITLSYAITIHKSQGSEYPAVVIPVSHKFSSMLDRSLLYTAVTRGKYLVIIVGSKSLFERALQNEMSRKRNTCLKEKIFDTFNS